MLKNILIYTRCYFIKKAIAESYHEMTLFGNRANVFHMAERVNFLVCATVLNDSYLFIDATDNRSEDTLWIMEKLNVRCFRGKVFVITKNDKLRKAVENKKYAIKSEFITDVGGLNRALTMITMALAREAGAAKFAGLPLRFKSKDTHDKVSDYIKCRVKHRVNSTEFAMMTNWNDYKYWTRQINTSSQAIANRRYNLRKKLNLDSLTEYYCLVNIINSASTDNQTKIS